MNRFFHDSSAWAYRGVMSALGRWVLPRLVSASRYEGFFSSPFLQAEEPWPSAVSPRAWFHASSAGELELLAPIIEAWCALGREAMVTVMSESADAPLKKFSQALRSRGAKLLFSGYCPWEGNWERALGNARPAVFVTAKYEAWPELWAALSRRGVPLAITGARLRRSLKIARAGSRILAGSAPRTALLLSGERDAAELEGFLPDARIQWVGEPRWERIRDRLEKGNPRARELLEWACNGRDLRGGILAQVWPEDLDRWASVWAQASPNDRPMWVVPHQLDAKMKGYFSSRLEALSPGRLLMSSSISSSTAKPDFSPVILVDEMGILLELYSGMEWAYVGGGFTRSPHSTLEPAIHGIPLATGPRGAERFSEIQALREIGQLSLVRDSAEISAWLNLLKESAAELPARISEWARNASRGFGATRRVIEALEALISQPSQ